MRIIIFLGLILSSTAMAGDQCDPLLGCPIDPGKCVQDPCRNCGVCRADEAKDIFASLPAVTAAKPRAYFSGK